MKQILKSKSSSKTNNQISSNIYADMINTTALHTLIVKKWKQELIKKWVSDEKWVKENLWSLVEKFKSVCEPLGIIWIEYIGTQQKRFDWNYIIYRVKSNKEIEQKDMEKFLFDNLVEKREFKDSPTPFDSEAQITWFKWPDWIYEYKVVAYEPYTD